MIPSGIEITIVVIIDEKVKRFGENEIIFEDFIVINKLPEL